MPSSCAAISRTSPTWAAAMAAQSRQRHSLAASRRASRGRIWISQARPGSPVRRKAVPDVPCPCWWNSCCVARAASEQEFVAQIDFYTLGENSRTLRMKAACQLAEKAVLAGERVLVWLQDAPALTAFHDLLWTFGDRSFVPHEPLAA